MVTVICSNRSYAILRLECARQRLPAAGPATAALTDLSRPAIDWLALAAGCGVNGVRATTVSELCAALADAIHCQPRGPRLIEAVLAG